MSWRSRSETASCRKKELEAFINFVANFHSALQFTFIVSEIELPFLDITLRISGTRIQISVHYNDTTLTTSSIFLLSIQTYSQFLRLRRICSSNADFLVRSKEMVSFVTYRGYPLSSSENDLLRVATISRHDSLRPSEQSDNRW